MALLLRSAPFPRGLPFDDEVRRRRLACIAQPMHFVRRLKDDRAWANLAAHTVQGRLDCPFLDQYQLFIRVMVRGVRSLAWIECCDMALQFVQRRRRRLKHLTAHAILCWL